MEAAANLADLDPDGSRRFQRERPGTGGRTWTCQHHLGKGPGCGELVAPAVEQRRRYVSPPRNLRHHRPRRERLSDKRPLLLFRPTPPTIGAADYLYLGHSTTLNTGAKRTACTTAALQPISPKEARRFSPNAYSWTEVDTPPVRALTCCRFRKHSLSHPRR